jgi:hypothetical protein
MVRVEGAQADEVLPLAAKRDPLADHVYNVHRAEDTVF